MLNFFKELYKDGYAKYIDMHMHTVYSDGDLEPNELIERAINSKIGTISITDHDSGMFVKGEHERIFAYVDQVACDKHGWILGYDVNKGSMHDSKAFLPFFDKLKEQYEELQNKFKNFFDIPHQNELGTRFPWCGYIDIDGKKYICEQCEHESIIRQIVLKEYLEEYLKVPASFYDHKPQGTFQEEYFAMKYLGFAKVSAFRDAPTKRIVFFYDKLTWKQSNVIYPR